MNVPDLDGTPLLVTDGRVYSLNVDGGLNAEKSPAADGALSLAVEKDGKVSPLIPEFDPANAEQAADSEAKIQKVLEALAGAEQAPGSPVVLYRNYLYRVIDGALDRSERKEPAAPSPVFFWLKDGRLIPLVADFERRTIAALTGTERTLTEEQVGLVLKSLGEKDHVYIASGKTFRLGAKGTLEANATKPRRRWPGRSPMRSGPPGKRSAWAAARIATASARTFSSPGFGRQARL